MRTAHEIIDLYSSVDTRLPWTEFKRVLPEFDKYTNDYSGKVAGMVGSIKTNILNSIDAYYEASRHVSEWSSLSSPLLKAHAQLFSDYSASKSQTQNRLLQKILGDGVQRMKTAQNELEKISNNFNAADGTLTALFKQLELDYDEDSDFFQTKLFHVRPTTNTRKLTDKFGRDVRKAIAELKERFSKVSKFYINIRTLVKQASLDMTDIEIAMKAQIRDFKELKKQSDILTDFVSVVDDREHFNSIVKSTGNLIVKCNEYTQTHR